MKYYIVDAFTDQPFGGNPAGVVLLEGPAFPDEGLMQHVATELRYSETVFMRRLSDTEWEARYFTPEGEVDICGHATVAAFHLLHSLGHANRCCRLRTRAGELEVVAGVRVMMQMAAPRIVSTIEEPEALYGALGLPRYRPTWPVQVVSTGLPDIILSLPDVATLQTLHPDMAAIASLTHQHEALSFHVFALGGDSHTAHVRDFAPGCGIPEESATGTANAALTHYLAAHGIIQPGDHSFLQGEAMGRPSVVNTRLAADGTVWVGGTATVVAEGVLRV